MGPQVLSVEPKSQEVRHQSALLLFIPRKVDGEGTKL